MDTKIQNSFSSPNCSSRQYNNNKNSNGSIGTITDEQMQLLESLDDRTLFQLTQQSRGHGIVINNFSNNIISNTMRNCNNIDSSQVSCNKCAYISLYA